LDSAVNACFGIFSIPTLRFAYPIQHRLGDEIPGDAQDAALAEFAPQVQPAPDYEFDQRIAW
jgi:hypothetical protein